MRLLLCILMFLLLWSAPATALQVEKRLEDPAAEAHAQIIFREVRCLVCAGETIADSPSRIAASLRDAIRQRVAGGKTQADILRELADEYGEEILMNPPLAAHTYALWFGPLILLLVGAVFVRYYFRRTAQEHR